VSIAELAGTSGGPRASMSNMSILAGTAEEVESGSRDLADVAKPASVVGGRSLLREGAGASHPAEGR